MNAGLGSTYFLGSISTGLFGCACSFCSSAGTAANLYDCRKGGFVSVCSFYSSTVKLGLPPGASLTFLLEILLTGSKTMFGWKLMIDIWRSRSSIYCLPLSDNGYCCC